MNQPYNESTLVQGGTKSDNLKRRRKERLLWESSIHASRKGSSSPSLLPQESPSTESMPLAA
jgi:hypothetical protein